MSVSTREVPPWQVEFYESDASQIMHISFVVMKEPGFHTEINILIDFLNGI